MGTINHEYYVSPEVAKLLKEAGFDWEIYDGYIIYENGDGFTIKFQTSHNFNGDNGDLFINYRGYQEVLSRPTLDVAQRWLREVKGYDVFVVPCNGLYFYTVRKYYHEDKVDYFDYPNNDAFHTYEEAQEAGIKKALEIILEKGE